MEGRADVDDGAGVGKLVDASSAAVYGFTEREGHHEDGPVAPATRYAIATLTGDTDLGPFASEHGQDTRRLRFVNLYGPPQQRSLPYAGVIASFATGSFAGEPLTSYGNGTRTPPHDLVDRAGLGTRRARCDHAVITL